MSIINLFTNISLISFFLKIAVFWQYYNSIVIVVCVKWFYVIELIESFHLVLSLSIFNAALRFYGQKLPKKLYIYFGSQSCPIYPNMVYISKSTYSRSLESILIGYLGRDYPRNTYRSIYSFQKFCRPGKSGL